MCIRDSHLKIARDAAVKARSQAMLTLKAIIVSAPAELREQLEGVRGKMTLVRHVAALRPGPIISTTASAKAALKAIARGCDRNEATTTAHLAFVLRVRRRERCDDNRSDRAHFWLPKSTRGAISSRCTS